MKVVPNDLGVCGVEQLMFAGTVNFDSTGVATGFKLCDVPANTVITKAYAVVKTAFNAGTTNVLTVGTNDDVNDLLGSSDITEDTAGAYGKLAFVECSAKTAVKAKFTQTGTEATAGVADVYIGVVRIPG